MVKLKEAVYQAQSHHILEVLRQTGWNKTRAAELLGISRKIYGRSFSSWRLMKRRRSRE